MSREVQEKDTVTIHYTARAPDGTVHDSSRERDPLTFTVGAGQVVPGVDRAVRGMRIGDSKTEHVGVDDAYGPRRDDLVAELEKTRLPQDMDPVVGEHLQLSDEEERVVVARIIDVKDDTVVLDANPPLAGQEIVFDIEVLDVSDTPA